MNEQASWIFYRYAIGMGTLFLGVAAIFISFQFLKIRKTVESIDKSFKSILVEEYK